MYEMVAEHGTEPPKCGPQTHNDSKVEIAYRTAFRSAFVRPHRLLQSAVARSGRTLRGNFHEMGSQSDHTMHTDLLLSTK